MPTLLEAFMRWETHPPPTLFGDPIWRLPAYRIALFLADVAQHDVEVLSTTRAPRHVGDQLARAVDSIGANISDGYGRLSGRERAHYYEMALGSAREAREWYFRSARWIGATVAEERAQLLTRAIRILTAAIPDERSGSSEARIRRARTRRGTADDPSTIARQGGPSSENVPEERTGD
jgi:four helix bundle protein